MTQAEVKHVVDLAYALYPHIPVTNEVYEAAYLALYQYHLGETQTALAKCLQKTGRVGPVRPDEIIETIDQEQCRQAAADRTTYDVTASAIHGMEEYRVNDSTGKPWRYIRCTKEARKDFEDAQTKAGMHKVVVVLPGGKKGYVWRK